jgi:hypothetical protein
VAAISPQSWEWEHVMRQLDRLRPYGRILFTVLILLVTVHACN